MEPTNCGKAASSATIYEEAAVAWYRAKEHFDQASAAHREAQANIEAATQAEHEAWLRLQDVAGRSPVAVAPPTSPPAHLRRG